jgi:putative membrane protein
MTMMWGGGWWVFGLVAMVVCMYLMIRMMDHGDSGHASHGDSGASEKTRNPREILAERFARGEITEAEFQERLRVLDHAG